MKFPIAAAVLLGAASAGCVVTVDSHSEIVREEKRFTVTGTPDVRLTTFDGSIEVQAWDKSEVVVEIEKRGSSKSSIEGLQVISSQNGNVIELEVKRPRSETIGGLGFHRLASAKLIVSVPRTVNLRARTGDGSIRVDDLVGRIDLRTGDGSVRASRVNGDVTIDTSDGSVTVADAEGRLAVETGDGSVSVSGRLAAVKLHTGDGSVVYRAAAGSAMAENWEITTGDGTVSMFLPDGFNADIDAHTGDGRITNDVRAHGDFSEERRLRTLRGKIGSGGKLLRIRTGDGAIRLKMN